MKFSEIKKQHYRVGDIIHYHDAETAVTGKVLTTYGNTFVISGVGKLIVAKCDQGEHWLVRSKEEVMAND